MNIKTLSAYDREARFKSSRIPGIIRKAFLIGTPALATLFFNREDAYRIAEKMMENETRTRVEQSATTRELEVKDSDPKIESKDTPYFKIIHDDHSTTNNYFYAYPTEEIVTTKETKTIDTENLSWFYRFKIKLLGYPQITETKTTEINRNVRGTKQLFGVEQLSGKENQKKEEVQEKKLETPTGDQVQTDEKARDPKKEAAGVVIKLVPIRGREGLLSNLEGIHQSGKNSEGYNILISKEFYQKYFDLVVLNRKYLFLGVNESKDSDQTIKQLKEIVYFYKRIGEFGGIAENLQLIVNTENNENIDLLLLLADGYYEQGNAWDKAIPAYERFLFVAEQQNSMGKSTFRKIWDAVFPEDNENLLMRLKASYRLARALEHENEFEKATGVIDYHLGTWYKIKSLKNIFSTASQQPVDKDSKISEKIEDQQLRLSSLKTEIAYRQGLNQGFKLWGFINVKSELFAVITHLLSVLVAMSAILAGIRKFLERENESKNIANAFEKRWRVGAVELRAYLDSEKSESEKSKLREALLFGQLDYYQFSQLRDIRNLTIKDIFDLLHTADERFLDKREFLYYFKNTKHEKTIEALWEILTGEKNYSDLFRISNPSHADYNQEFLKYFVCRYFTLEEKEVSHDDRILLVNFSKEHKATLTFLERLMKETDLNKREKLLNDVSDSKVDSNFLRQHRDLLLPTVSSINKSFRVKENWLDWVISFFKK